MTRSNVRSAESSLPRKSHRKSSERTEESFVCAHTALRTNIEMGERTGYIWRYAVIYLLLLIFFVISVYVFTNILTSFGVNAYILRLAALPVFVLLLAAMWTELVDIANTQYWVESGVLLGDRVYIDLWNVMDVQYEGHRVRINDTTLDHIPKPKVFLSSLEVVFFQLTNEHLP